jgi:hypothetical protein
MKRAIATITLAAGVAIVAMNCDRIGHELATGVILMMTGMAMGYCVGVKESGE